MARKEKGPARSKKPGCSIEFSPKGTWHQLMTPSGGQKQALEGGRSAKAEYLGPVVGGLEQGLREIGAQRSERRLPDEADAGRQADVRTVVDEAVFRGHCRLGKSARHPQRSGIDKDRALHAEIVGNERKREAGFGGRCPE